MGCDIHIFIEWKKGDQPWTKDSHHIAHEDYNGDLLEVDADGRDYDLFAALSGVRGDGPDANGLPPDVTKDIDYTLYNSDYHSISFYSLEDFMDIYFRLYPSDKVELDNAVPIAFDRGNYNLNYLNLFSYCLKKKQEFQADLIAESMLLDQPMNTNVECRLVFGYDS